jgi:methionine biosynthesis protein MetW
MHSPSIVTFENLRPVRDVEIVVLVPVSPAIEGQFINSCTYLVQRAAAPFRISRLVFDPTGVPPPAGKPHPYRQEALARIRQDMVDKYLGTADWVAWIDADIVEYPANLLADLITRADGGIAAPVVLMDGELGSRKLNEWGFGPGRFFDIAGYVEDLRWARFEEPWFDQPGPEYSLDSVGSCYVVNAEIYRRGARHTVDPYSLDFVRRKLRWCPDTVETNQEGPANCFTEHFSVCQWAKQHGYPVRAHRDLVARHAGIPSADSLRPAIDKLLESCGGPNGDQPSPDRNAAGFVDITFDAVRYEWYFGMDPDEVPGIVGKMIPRGSRILDVGCGTGSISRLLADECEAEVVGVEPDAERARHAIERGLRVHVGYLDRKVIRESGPFDIVLLADVLEHLPNPQKMLLLAHEALQPGGAVIVSVPNMAHWSVRLCLLRGKFEYSRNGIMDATHLRWFTLDAIKSVLSTSGFQVTDYRPTAGQWLPENAGRAPLRWLSEKARKSFLRNASKRWPTLFAAQHVLKAEVL